MYPNYLNSKKTTAEGRRIPKSAACEDPTVVEMLDCCKYLKLPAEIEQDKCYSRDWLVRGRLRVQLKSEDGNPLNPEVSNRRTLLIRIAELLPKHPNRSKKGGTAPVAKPETVSAAASSSNQQLKGKGNKKKKGK